MNVRNDLQGIQPISGGNQVSGAQKTSGASRTTQSIVPGDEAHLSSAASLASHAASLPDVRMDKVQSVQAAIISGSYNVSSTDVAQSMMGHMLGN